ncbi:RnfABCDGE type electron transport complex subunit B [Halomonas piscis]|uniref:RnfABCDGE type electron transport complex subunit B n=1 Tax=Halomonas piscis TaxID=3031727 RepID=UPI0028A063A2|nr:RnfABCDGE type electron transport complex subunit B [Halomonas piscis]
MSRHASLIEAVDALLPQTQCGKCGFDGCLPYARAIAEGEPVNRCPPGGEATLAALVELTGQPYRPLAEPAQPPLAAVIRENECIGCTKCIDACPVDAILGAAKRMHTVITDECTGCELCVAPCPVDCIDMVAHPAWQAAKSEAEQEAYLERRAALGRERHRARQARLERDAREKRQERRRRRLQKRQAPAAGGQASRAAAQRQKRLAVRAAEQALRRVEQQLESALRRRDAEAEATAREQLPEAERLLAEARQALENTSKEDSTP